MIEKISRGLIWRVKKVLRYFYSDEGQNIQTEEYALKVKIKKNKFYLKYLLT